MGTVTTKILFALFRAAVRHSTKVALLVVLVGTFVGGPAASTLAYGEPKKATGTAGSAVVVAHTQMFLASTLLTGQLQSRSRDLISQDPDWNRATLFSVSFWDAAMQLERLARGHMVITHPGGDQTFVQYEISWKNLGPIELEWEIAGRFVRGTGRFKGITGTWHERGKSTSVGDLGDWEAQYSLP